MTLQAVKQAKQEAERFLAKLDAFLYHHEEELRECPFVVGGSKHSGALRRASLDLSNALSEMRKVGNTAGRAFRNGNN